MQIHQKRCQKKVEFKVVCPLLVESIYKKIFQIIEKNSNNIFEISRCEEKFKEHELLTKHLNSMHQIDINYEERTFNSAEQLDSFMKEQLERTGFKYCKR